MHNVLISFTVGFNIFIVLKKLQISTFFYLNFYFYSNHGFKTSESIVFQQMIRSYFYFWQVKLLLLHFTVGLIL